MAGLPPQHRFHPSIMCCKLFRRRRSTSKGCDARRWGRSEGRKGCAICFAEGGKGNLTTVATAIVGMIESAPSQIRLRLGRRRHRQRTVDRQAPHERLRAVAALRNGAGPFGARSSLFGRRLRTFVAAEVQRGWEVWLTAVGAAALAAVALIIASVRIALVVSIVRCDWAALLNQRPQIRVVIKAAVNGRERQRLLQNSNSMRWGLRRGKGLRRGES